MIFRRRNREQPDEAADPSAREPGAAGAATGEADDVIDALANPRPRGPWDRTETDADEGDDSYLDLGGLVVRGAEGLELRLHVEDQQGAVAAVMLAGPDRALELRAFAAPRSGGIWDDIRADLAAEAVRMGGSATETDGEFGTELTVRVPIRTPDGKQGFQPSRIVGVEGPRWLLRGTFLGKAALEPDPDGALEAAFRDVIVVRGAEPMAPRDPIPMHMPPQAQAELLGSPDVP